MQPRPPLLQATHFHREPCAIKTDAPNVVVSDVLRTWAREHPPKTGADHPMLTKAVETEGIDFTVRGGGDVAGFGNSISHHVHSIHLGGYLQN